ncbi:MAG: hypothetical protein A3H69_04175 [Candidatus Sungbacteria bacterium RIFCSPLOWO2_02_FULL_47_9]|nr:MAG: hypothetical protein A3H69_04175 [Candidatus Sungbacteria bacterium RIFCSPLOWO2_02_FULL_47_9]
MFFRECAYIRRIMQARGPERGFTLVEMMFGLFVMALVGITIWTFLADIFRFSDTFQKGASSEQEVRTVFKLFTSELRSATQSAGGAFTLAETSTSSIRFYSDITGDGQAEQLHYYRSETDFIRGVINPVGGIYATSTESASTVIQGIRNAASSDIFQYYDKTYTGTTSPLAQPVTSSEVRLVKITLNVDPNLGRAPASTTFITEVMIRNLKDNL